MNFYKKINKYKKHFLTIGIIILITVFFNKLLFNNVIYESDDYKHHAVRIANYYLGLKQGQLPVRWGPNLNGSYGYPSFNYMYHTPYLIGSLIHMAGLSIQQSLNLTVLGSLVAAVVSAYLFISSYLKSKKWQLLLSLFYVFNPYILLNVYWRGAVGELYFYALVPLFLLGVKNLLKNRSDYFYLALTSITTALLILSHLPSMLLLLILSAIFIVSEIKKEDLVKRLSTLSLAGLLGILLSAWYWIPAYFEQWMVTYENAGSLTQYITQFANPFSVLNITKNIFSSNYFLPVLNIGGVSLLSFFIGIYLYKYSKKIIYWIGLFLSSLFLLSSYSKPLWDVFVPLQYVQFPWRFLWIINISTLMILINFIINKKISAKIKNFSFALIFIGTIFSAQAYTASKGTSFRSDFDLYHPTSETGSSFNEHLPIWAKMPYEFPNELMYVNASESSKLNSDNLNEYVHELSQINANVLLFDGTTISYTLNHDVDIIVLHKRLFYPGWEAFLEGNRVEFVSDVPEYNGILAVYVPKGSSTVNINFSGYTKLRMFAEYISLAAVIFMIGQIIFKKYTMKR